METCGLCCKKVEKLKSGSHVIPRWIMKAVKGGGAAIRIGDGSIINWQEDLIDSFVCDGCEIIFGADDSFSASFFSKLNGRIVANAMDVGGYHFSLEEHEVSQKDSLLRFVFSILVRFELYCRVRGIDSVIGSRFDELRVAYFTEQISQNSFPVLIERYDSLNLVVREPIAFVKDGVKFVEVVLLGWRFIVRVDSIEHLEHDKAAAFSEFFLKMYKKNGPLVDELLEDLKTGVRKGALKKK